MGKWRQRQLANGRKWGRGSASSVPKFPAESQPQCDALQTRQSATCRSPTKASSAWASSPQPSPTSPPASSQPSVSYNGKEGENPATKGHRDPGVFERSPLIYLESRRRKKDRRAKEKRGLNEIQASPASRRSQVENAGPEKKNPYRCRRCARRRSQIHVPYGGC